MPDIRIQIPAYHSGQKIVERERNRHNVIACGRRWGKTVYGVRRCIEFMLKGYPVAWFAPNYKYLAEAWRMFETILAPIVKSKNKTDRRIELITGGSIDFWSLDDVDSGRGYKYRHIVVDEAAKSRYLKAWWTESGRPALSDFKGSSDWLSTPKGRDYFYELYSRGSSNAQKDKAWSCWQMPSDTNDKLPWLAEEMEEAQNDMPPRSYQQEYLAQFLDAVSSGLFDPEQWKYGHELTTNVRTWVRFWDLAVAEGAENDYTAGVLLGVTEHGGDIWIADVRRYREPWPVSREIIKQTWYDDQAMLEAVYRTQGKKPPVYMPAVEKAGQQKGLIDDLNWAGDMWFAGDQVKGDLKERTSMWAWRQTKGQVCLLLAPWNSDFTEECAFCNFDGRDHDDQISAASGAFGLLYKAAFPDKDKQDGPAYGSPEWHVEQAKQRAKSSYSRYN